MRGSERQRAAVSGSDRQCTGVTTDRCSSARENRQENDENRMP